MSRHGKVVGVAICVFALLVMIWMYRTYFGRSPQERRSADRIFICSETGKSFEATLKIGMTIPIHSPYSGKDTGYPAELCYWTADGKPKEKPTPVLLNEVVGKPGPTFCPDCGRLVVGHNPVPQDDRPPPPTRQEYEERHKSTGSN